MRALDAGEAAIVAGYVDAFAREIEPLGHSAGAGARAARVRATDDLVAIDFVPTAAFEQTPGTEGRHAASLAADDAPLDAIRQALDGAIPATVATVAPDGVPNISYVSQVYYVDPAHVALSYQFFNKTRQNVLATRRAAVLVIDPESFARYRIALEYVRLETSGPLFERMKAHLAGIASHTGMAGVFKLQGADVYRVLGDRAGRPATRCPGTAPQRHHLAAVRAIAQRIAGCADLSNLLDEALAALDDALGIRHAMILMADSRAQKLYTVASRGYDASGVGSRDRVRRRGDRRRGARAHADPHHAPRVRMGLRSRDPRERGRRRLCAACWRRRFPCRGCPIRAASSPCRSSSAACSTAVLYVEDVLDRRFGFDDEDALVAVAALLGPTIRGMQELAESAAEPAASGGGAPPVQGPPVTIRRYAADDSIFLGDDYLIKGVAGAIFWKLLRDFTGSGRTEFTNRELRLDPSIRLPDLTDNLEARLILLSRRLAERAPYLAIEKTGRGRFRFCVRQPVELDDVAGAANR